MPITYTQPAHLAALLVLFGLDAPSPAIARVLEIGCATGANILPLAMRFPRARFTGLDLSADHIRRAEGEAAELELENVTFLRADVADVDLGAERFDVIICHGVYSWVPDGARAAILRLCGRHLAPEGVAAISFNVLPGWHRRMAVRDIALRAAGKGPAADRVRRARSVINRFAAALDDSTLHGRILRSEAARLAQRPASYILGELLSPWNTPRHVADVIGEAREAGLDYLCEGDVAASSDTLLRSRQGAALRLDSATPRAQVEQVLDDLTGRTFRRALFVRAGRVPARPAVLAARLRPLHLSGRLTPLPEARPGFADAHGRAVATQDAATVEALARLAGAWPATTAVADLAGDAPSREEPDGALLATLVDLLRSGTATASTVPLRIGEADAERPAGWRLARREAARGQPWLSSLDHVGVPVPRSLLPLLARLDGSLDRAAIEARLAVDIEAGLVPAHLLPPLNGHGNDPVHRAKGAARRLLAFLASHALLDPEAV